MELPYRHNFKWNINELLALQREYELLEMTIQEIAEKHERTENSILYRLQLEEFIESWTDARGYVEYINSLNYEECKCIVGSLNCNDSVDDKDSDYVEENNVVSEEEEEEDDEDYNYNNTEDDISSLNQRVWGLESAVGDIKSMVNKLLYSFSTSSKPLKKLRQYKTQSQSHSQL